MRVIVQRVQKARVHAEGNLSGSIEYGLLALLGVCGSDSPWDAQYLARKVASLRIFPGTDGKMNLNVNQCGGAILVVSNFTLYGDTDRGNRPSFEKAAKPQLANSLYEEFLRILRASDTPVAAGVFGAHMEIEMVADGPVTISIDSEKARPSA